MLARAITLTILVLVCTATSCIAGAAIAVALAPTVGPDSAGKVAFPLVARIAARRKVEPSTPPDPEGGAAACYLTQKSGQEADNERR